MKLAMVGSAAIFAALLFVNPVLGAQNTDTAITKVVKLLQDMLDKSNVDGDKERSLYAKYKCYCDQNEAAKNKEIGTLTEEIGLLQSQIEKLLASSAELSEDVAKLKSDMEANDAARKEADSVRASEKAAFDTLQSDLTAAITSMNEAIQELSTIGADQSLAKAAADHEQFMAQYKPTLLVKLRTVVKQALVAASAVISKKQAALLETFLQQPSFTGAYTPVSVEVVGILKEMKETFTSNLDTAVARETTAVDAHTKFMTSMQNANDSMEDSFKSKQEALSGNDGNLAAKRGQLTSSEGQKGEAETFLTDLVAMCTEKTKQYNERTLLRTNEQAAIAQAISILNSDEAFELFNTVKATKAESFLQRATVRRHQHEPATHIMQGQQAQMFLRKAVGSNKSALLSKILALLEASNPFAVVLAEIQKMIELLAAEEKVDDEQFAWCQSERQTNNANLIARNSEITSLNGVIEGLVADIEDPVTGLKTMIKADEESLATNSQSQTAETKDRAEDNLVYEQNIRNLVGAEELLTTAIAVLEKYYSKILGSQSAFLAISRSKQPTPPETWDDGYKGQAEHTDAISMLKFILDNTKQEEAATHTAEKVAQHAFEDSMKSLKTEEASLQQSLAGLRLSLTKKEEELLGKRADLKATKAEKLSIEAYLSKIAPGCDFITTNIAKRKSNRKEEQTALETAVTLLKQTPAYLAASTNESLAAA